MKSVSWSLFAVLVLAVIAILWAPTLSAKLRRSCQGGAGQSAEGQALLSQEWTRINASSRH
jgi:hypothetical protein